MSRFAKILFTLLVTSLIATYCTQSLAVKVVRVHLDYDNDDSRYLDLELYDDITGLTPSVTNFLNYVNDDGVNGHRYDGTFITRSIPGFILQSGSYTFRPTDPATEMLTAIDGTSALQLVPTDASVTNAFNLSNLRGTVAFAKTPNDPDSATSGWFINLDDNSENLDNQNGGFTVFGSVIDDGMEIVDEMSTFPIQPYVQGVLGPDFADFPVVNYDFLSFPGIYRSNIIMLSNFSVITRPIVRATPASIDYELDVAGDGMEKLVTTTLRNTGNETLTINTIDDPALPYSINTDSCTAVTLVPQSVDTNSTCTIIVSFSPTIIGAFGDKLIIHYTSTADNSPYSVAYNLTGEGVQSNAVSTVSTSEIVFEDTAINSSTSETVTVRNKGGNQLSISAINITGADNAQFTVDNTGCMAGSLLNINETCDLIVNFEPSIIGTKNATLEILTNSNTSSISLNGAASRPELSVQASISLVGSINQTVSELFTATNIGDGNLIFTDISITGPDAGYFTEQNNCPDTNNSGTPTQALSANGTCGLYVEFTATDETARYATLTITSNDPTTPTFDIALIGKTSTSKISTPTTFNVGTAQINGSSATKELSITNTGDAPLEIADITGLSSSDFIESNNCVGTGVQINLDKTCSIFITLTTSTLGSHSATLTINSNDPLTPTISIDIIGYGDNDTDGIISSIELESPNSGDNNNDGITDDYQSNVASLLASNSNYITFISDNSLLLDIETSFVDLKLLDSIPSGQPDSANFVYGIFSYSISVPAGAGDGVNIGILLPANENPTVFYKYGPTIDNTTPHWYDFSYDAASGTGAQFFGPVSLLSPTGTTIQRNLVIVNYIDGSRGDDDLEPNGSIQNIVTGLSHPSEPSDSGSGSLSLALLAFLMSIQKIRIINFRKHFKYVVISRLTNTILILKLYSNI